VTLLYTILCFIGLIECYIDITIKDLILMGFSLWLEEDMQHPEQKLCISWTEMLCYSKIV